MFGCAQSYVQVELCTKLYIVKREVYNQPSWDKVQCTVVLLFLAYIG